MLSSRHQRRPVRTPESVRLVSTSVSTPDASDTSSPTPHASPSRSPQNQIPERRCIPPAPTISNRQHATQTRTLPAPRIENSGPPLDPLPDESMNTPRMARSHAPPTESPHKNATLHPIAVGEMPRSSRLRVKSKLPSRPPALPQIPPAAPRAESLHPTGMSAGNIHPPDALP